MSDSAEQLAGLTASIVAAYLAHNAVQTLDLPALIESVHAAVAGLGRPAAPETPVPAVNPTKSIFPGYIICLDDGKKFMTMRSHLTKLGTTPAEYRAKWSLPNDYPMVAANYAAARSAIARKSGLGRKPAAKNPAVKGKAKRAKKKA